MFRAVRGSIRGAAARASTPGRNPAAAFGTGAQGGTFFKDGRAFEKRLPLRVPHDARGTALLHDPLWNKGTAHSVSERERLGLRGLLPPRVMTMESQVERIMAMIQEQPDDIQKAILLSELLDRNETLFHRVLVTYIEELAPLVYTPTVGRVCLEYGDRFRRPRGMYFSADDRGCFATMMYNWPQRDVHVCVVTDGSRILGLGDLGINGMGIPVGKLALYCAAGGIAPHRVLPAMLDVGTNNEALLKSPSYLGLRRPRLQGQEYDDVVEEFMVAMRHHFPRACVQFEDFSSDHAGDILAKYRDESLCFNDDIQGTGCVALAGLLSALKLWGSSATAAELKDQRVLVAGAGSAGLGVASMLAQGMVQQGLSEAEARRRFYICDKDGLIGASRLSDPAKAQLLDPAARNFAQPDGDGVVKDGMTLLEAARAAGPTVLLGLSAVPQLFTKELVETVHGAAVAKGGRGIIFPLSNPTANAECTAEQAYGWTGGACVFASGSPFGAVNMDGKTLVPSQCNNMFIFPGLGLGSTVSGALKITDTTLYASALALADCLTSDERGKGQVFPSVRRIREVSERVALAVMKSTALQGLATASAGPASGPMRTWGEAEMLGYLQRKTYDPYYVPLGIDPYAGR